MFFISAYLVLLICCGLCLYRVGRGPTAADRATAIDIFGIVVLCFTALLSLKTGRAFYMDIGIAWAIISFIGTIALAKHLEGRGFDE
ncbi:MAG: monovalent cation/H+ antiporter complex subunit F [Kiritimatiellae bacterium]|jgi:multicomponent Na+:H+ antiporter subunit F|nr:monovalent cation/H+ antiporter complex subunit F [Kiritimatiellia bacterium]